MPRNWVRKFPRTTAVMMTGKCGHEFSDRIRVPVALVGAVRTAELEDELASHIEMLRGWSAKQSCPDCSASDETTWARERLTSILGSLDLPVPAPFDGPVRQVAHAEKLRLQFVERASVMARPNGWSKSVGSRLLLRALASAFGPAGSYSDDIANLRAPGLRARKKSPPDRIEVAETLMGWLLGRAAVRSAMSGIEWQDTAEAWVRMRHGRGSGWLDRQFRLADQQDAGVLLAAALVAAQTGWVDRFAAESAFAALSGYASDGELELLADGSGPFADRVEQLLIMRALSRGSDWSGRLVAAGL